MSEQGRSRADLVYLVVVLVLGLIYASIDRHASFEENWTLYQEVARVIGRRLGMGP